MKAISWLCAVLLLSGSNPWRASAASPPSANPAGVPLVVEGDVPAPPEEVWRLYTTRQGVQEWMAAQADLPLSPGALWRTRYAAGGTLGDRKTIVNELLAFEPNRMFAIRVARAPEGFPWPELVKRAWTVVYLAPVSGGTHLRIVGLGYPDTEEGRKLRSFFEKGNAWELRRLREHLEKKARGEPDPFLPPPAKRP
jgi:uncharacterized protein YndB with AHSA1/START domain